MTHFYGWLRQSLAFFSLAFSFFLRSSSSCSRSRSWSLSSSSLCNLERPCALVELWRCSRLHPSLSLSSRVPLFDILHPCFLLSDMSDPSRLLIPSFSRVPSCGDSFSAFLGPFPQLLVSAKPPLLFFLSRTKSFSDRATLELDPQRLPSISCNASQAASPYVWRL